MSRRRTRLTYSMLPTLLLLVALDGRAAGLDLDDCRLTDPDGRHGISAQCGTLSVAEDPERPDGRRVELFVARIPALVAQDDPQALTIIQGGPGGSSVDLYLRLRGAFEAARRTRDILLVEQRGTGRSLPLRCPEGELDRELEMNPQLARELGERCLAALPRDPRFYTTSVAVGDLDAVRAAAGYARLDVYGVSYGTRVALHYLRRHPERVRTLTLDGVAPPDWVLGPDIARFAQATLDAVFERCARDAPCTEAFGDVAATFVRLRDRLAATPVDLTLDDPLTGRPRSMRFDVDDLRVAVRLLSYQSETQALIPLLLDRAAAGDPEPLAAQSLLLGERFGAIIALGMHSAVVCTEDIPFIDDLEGLEDTYLGAVQVESMQALCADWPRGILDAGFHEPVRSDVPALILSGQYDPVTPPANGARAAAHLARARVLTAPGQGHGVVGRGCLPRVFADFLESADPAGLDAACVQRLGPLPFFVDSTGPTP